MPLRRLPPTEYRRHIPCFMQISWLAHADLPSVSSRYAAGGQRLLRVGCTACAHRQLSLTLHPRPSRPPCSTTNPQGTPATCFAISPCHDYYVLFPCAPTIMYTNR